MPMVATAVNSDISSKVKSLKSHEGRPRSMIFFHRDCKDFNRKNQNLKKTKDDI